MTPPDERFCRLEMCPRLAEQKFVWNSEFGLAFDRIGCQRWKIHIDSFRRVLDVALPQFLDSSQLSLALHLGHSIKLICPVDHRKGSECSIPSGLSYVFSRAPRTPESSHSAPIPKFDQLQLVSLIRTQRCSTGHDLRWGQPWEIGVQLRHLDGSSHVDGGDVRHSRGGHSTDPHRHPPTTTTSQKSHRWVRHG